VLRGFRPSQVEVKVKAEVESLRVRGWRLDTKGKAEAKGLSGAFFTPLLRQIALMNNGVLDEIEETPEINFVDKWE